MSSLREVTFGDPGHWELYRRHRPHRHRRASRFGSVKLQSPRFPSFRDERGSYAIRRAVRCCAPESVRGVVGLVVRAISRLLPVGLGGEAGPVGYGGQFELGDVVALECEESWRTGKDCIYAVQGVGPRVAARKVQLG